MGLGFLISHKANRFLCLQAVKEKIYVHLTIMCKLHIRTVKVRGMVVSITYRKAKPIQNQTELVQHP
jgi:hypothetical protein